MVQRYEFITLRSGEGYLTKSDEGRLVSYEDYEKLEAAQKLNPLSVNVSELEATYIGDIRLHMAAISNWKLRAEAAEAELSAANAKPKPISFDELADRVQFVTGGIRMSFDPLNCKGHQIVPFMNFNSLSRIVEMYRSTETYHLAGFTVEGE